jgi:glucosamine 6-phosphate synthetase-like amidotransferase/phosphosugar isomerase protein
MCGLTGIIFGKHSRSCDDYEELKEIFTSMFILSEQRGRHASGLATLDTTGKTHLYKLPVPPTRMVNLAGFNKILSTVNNKTTLLIGHSRWKTVGSEYNNNNNQPIISGSILGTHNGTISNATALFARYQLKRLAEVDSEVLFRMADASLQEGTLNTVTYKNYLAECQGDLSCVFASKADPKCVYLFKGSKPLFLYYNPRLQVIIYSSNDAYIDASIVDSDGWFPLKMPENRMYQTCFDDFKNVVSDSFTFVRNQPISNYVKKKSKPQRSLFVEY